mmetsp:Transcript_81859/g.230408  ORF Transcript_81859/g.230408 Transcript_81859/m.230408 type:complete len:201 (-) Transcript_81859:327-929(-)
MRGLPTRALRAPLRLGVRPVREGLLRGGAGGIGVLFLALGKRGGGCRTGFRNSLRARLLLSGSRRRALRSVPGWIFRGGLGNLRVRVVRARHLREFDRSSCLFSMSRRRDNHRIGLQRLRPMRVRSRKLPTFDRQCLHTVLGRLRLRDRQRHDLDPDRRPGQRSLSKGSTRLLHRHGLVSLQVLGRTKALQGGGARPDVC